MRLFHARISRNLGLRDSPHQKPGFLINLIRAVLILIAIAENLTIESELSRVDVGGRIDSHDSLISPHTRD